MKKSLFDWSIALLGEAAKVSSAMEEATASYSAEYRSPQLLATRDFINEYIAQLRAAVPEPVFVNVETTGHWDEQNGFFSISVNARRTRVLI